MWTIMCLLMVITNTGVVTDWWGWLMAIGCDLTTFVIGCWVGWYQHKKFLEKGGSLNKE